MTNDTPSTPYMRTKWFYFNDQGCSVSYWLPGPHQGTNNVGQKVTVKTARDTKEEICELKSFGSVFGVCFASDRYDIATVTFAGGCDDAICYNTDSVRFAYDRFYKGATSLLCHIL